jgi:chemotaxis protein MotB
MITKMTLGLLLLAAALVITGCAELQELRQVKVMQESRISELEKQNNDLKDSYYKLKVEREKDQVKYTSQIEFLQKDVETLKESRSDREETLRQENLSLNRDLQSLTIQIQSAKADLTKQKEEYEKIKAEQDAFKKQNESDTKRSEDDKVSLSSEVSSLKDRIKKMEDDLSERETRISDLNTKVSQMEKDLKEKNAQLEQYQSSESQKQEVLKSQNALKEAELRFKKNLESEVASGAMQLFSYERGFVIRLFTDELFNRETVLINDTAKPLLLKISSLLNTYPEYKIDIEGHTDNTPIQNLPFVDNLALSSARADHVVRFLIEEGKVASERIKSLSCSSFHPADTNKTPEGRRINRRVEIIVRNKE